MQQRVCPRKTSLRVERNTSDVAQITSHRGSSPGPFRSIVSRCNFTPYAKVSNICTDACDPRMIAELTAVHCARDRFIHHRTHVRLIHCVFESVIGSSFRAQTNGFDTETAKRCWCSCCIRFTLSERATLLTMGQKDSGQQHVVYCGDLLVNFRQSALETQSSQTTRKTVNTDAGRSAFHCPRELTRNHTQVPALNDEHSPSFRIQGRQHRPLSSAHDQTENTRTCKKKHKQTSDPDADNIASIRPNVMP